MVEYFSKKTVESKLAPGVSFTLLKMSKGRRTSFNLKIAPLLARKSDLQTKLIPVSEEISRAEEQAKAEPCVCRHALDEAATAKRMGEIKKISPDLEVGLKDICHSAVTGRCIMEGCQCRMPRPDASIGGYIEYRRLLEELAGLDLNEISEERIRFFVSGVQGLKIDGQDATVESLVDSGDEALVEELSAELTRLLSPTQDELTGFKQPTTGDAAVVRPQIQATGQQNADSANPGSSTNSAIADFGIPI